MRYLSIKNLSKYQHYKDRRPPWIKLHASLFDDYEFQCLQDASKLHLILLWLLASQVDNHIPYDVAFIQRKLGTTLPIDMEVLIQQGFIEVSHDDGKTLALCKQSDVVETEAYTTPETYKKETDIRAVQETAQESELIDREFATLWTIYPKREGGNSRHDALKAYRARRRTGVEYQAMLDGTERYANYCQEKGWIRTAFVKQAAAFYGPGEHYLESWEVGETPLPPSRMNPADRISETIAKMAGGGIVS
jgi:hypothetical protein